MFIAPNGKEDLYNSCPGNVNRKITAPVSSPATDFVRKPSL
jgi:hypothetical protein